MKTAAEFIEFFEAIPEEKWTVGSFIDEQGQCCAYGHLGCRDGQFPEPVDSDALCDLFRDCSVVRINDGQDARFKQPTPKQRILAALREIQAKEQQP